MDDNSHMRLKYQLFLTLLTASALLITLFYLISSWTFSRGFLSYVNSSEINRVDRFIDTLSEEYEEHGSWDFLTENPSAYSRMQRPFRRGSSLSNNRGSRDSGPRESSTRNSGTLDNGRRNSDTLDNGRRDSDTLDNGSRDISTSDSSAPTNRSKPPNGKRPPRPEPPGNRSMHWVLADVDKNPLIGRYSERADMIWREVQSNEKLVGFVGFQQLQRVDRQFDQAFERQQKQTFGLTALLMALFSALLAVPLASRIVRPLLRVNNAVSEISEGNFEHRIIEKRKDEIGDLAANINQLGHTLEQNRDARQRWVAEISHELRTPLAVVNAEIEAMQDGIREPNASSLASLHSEVANLGRIVEDLHTLSLSDVGALNYKMSAVNVSHLVTDFLQSNQPQLDAKPISLTLDATSEKAIVLADKLRLEQLLGNLLQNTLRYTHANGELSVSVLTQSDNLILQWSDSTPGVSEDALAKLFDPLFRAEESRNRESGGAGLGLAIVAKIVEAHSGNISAQQSNKGGITIRVELPLHGGQS